MAANQPIGKLIMTSQEWEVSEGKGRHGFEISQATRFYLAKLGHKPEGMVSF